MPLRILITKRNKYIDLGKIVTFVMNIKIIHIGKILKNVLYKFSPNSSEKRYSFKLTGLNRSMAIVPSLILFPRKLAILLSVNDKIIVLIKI
jgi:hypothetical protein